MIRSLGRVSIVALAVLAILAGSLLSAAPALHEHLHDGAPASHFCVVTFFASGSCEAPVIAPVHVIPDQPQPLATLTVQEIPARPRLQFFTRLEHAPPAFS